MFIEVPCLNSLMAPFLLVLVGGVSLSHISRSSGELISADSFSTYALSRLYWQLGHRWQRSIQLFWQALMSS